MKKQFSARALASTNSTSNYTNDKESILHQFVHWILNKLDNAE